MQIFKTILCDYMGPINDSSCEFVKNGAVVLCATINGLDKQSSEDGHWTIFWTGSRKELDSIYQKIQSDFSDGRTFESFVREVDYSAYTLMPGFVDLHFHWVQEDVRQMPKDSLLDWLSNYTWPEEAKYADRDFALEKCRQFKVKLLSMGTLGGACYASLHAHTVEMGLENFCGDFILGNVLMTENGPEYLCHSEQEAMNDVKKLAGLYKDRYALTPRFAPTVSGKFMSEVAQVARQNDCFIQTHLSETPEECKFVLDLYKVQKGYEDVKNYTQVYERANILSSKTIMGHGIYLSDEELETLALTQTSIAHCPTSNAPLKEKGLGSGLFDFSKAESFGIRWALGSDIGGGPLLSMFDVMDSFVRQNQKVSKDATYTKALYRATAAGADILGLQKCLGRIAPGVNASFIAVKTPDNSASLSPEQFLAKLCQTDGDFSQREGLQNLVEMTFFCGNKVYSREQN